MIVHSLWLLAALAGWACGPRRRWDIAPWIAAGTLESPVALLCAALVVLAMPYAKAAVARLQALVRKDDIRRAVPGLLTDLAMAAEAGQPLHLALRYAHLYEDGPLAQALGAFRDRVSGGQSVAAALERMRKDLGTEETDRLMALLGRDAQLGVPLRESVARYRRNEMLAARREAQRAGAYIPYVFTAIAGVLLIEGVGLIALPWFLNLWRLI